MLRVQLRPSRRLALVLVTAHVCAAGTLIPLDVPLWSKVAGAIAVVASLVVSLRRHALLRSSGSVTAVELRGGDRAAVHLRTGACLDARILPTTYVSARLTVLNLRLPAHMLATHVVILADSADAESFRRLRVLLRWDYQSRESCGGQCD